MQIFTLQKPIGLNPTSLQNAILKSDEDENKHSLAPREGIVKFGQPLLATVRVRIEMWALILMCVQQGGSIIVSNLFVPSKYIFIYNIYIMALQLRATFRP